MPWKEVSVLEQRREFVRLADHPGANMSALCRRFGISRPTGYKWLQRYREGGDAALTDHSRRPETCPTKTPPPVEAAVLEVRAHPDRRTWGARKIHAWLREHGPTLEPPIAPDAVPAVSTCHAILDRHEALAPGSGDSAGPWQRFEAAAPNVLWQMDFKGKFRLEAPGAPWCHPLTLLDDHSRFALGIRAGTDQQRETVRSALTAIFQQYGLPETMLMDNGSPWGVPKAGAAAPTHFSRLAVWLLRLGIRVTHSRPYHPQTHGKIERFHKTLETDVLQWHTFDSVAAAQAQFETFRTTYNVERPHEALDMRPPVTQYAPSPRAFPEHLPPIDYAPDTAVRKVMDDGCISFQGQLFTVGKAFHGYPVGLRPTPDPDIWTLYFCDHELDTITLQH